MEDKDKTTLNVRKKITIWALLLIIKIVEPTQWTSDYATELKEMVELLKKA
jgi:hypothetical protein